MDLTGGHITKRDFTLLLAILLLAPCLVLAGPRYGFVGQFSVTITGARPYAGVYCWYDLSNDSFILADTCFEPPALDDSVVYLTFEREVGRGAVEAVGPFNEHGHLLEQVAWLSFERDSTTGMPELPAGDVVVSKALYERRRYELPPMVAPAGEKRWGDVHYPKPDYELLRRTVLRALPGLGIDTARLGPVRLHASVLYPTGKGLRSWGVHIEAPLRDSGDRCAQYYEADLWVPEDTMEMPDVVMAAVRDSALGCFTADGLPLVLPNGIDVADVRGTSTYGWATDIDGDEYIEEMLTLSRPEAGQWYVLRREEDGWTVKATGRDEQTWDRQ